MKVRIVELEGTPAELAASDELKALLAGRPTGSTPVVQPVAATASSPATAGEWDDVIPEDIREYIVGRTGNLTKQNLCLRFVGEVLSWGNTEAEVGRSKNSKDGKTPYLMLRNTGRRYFGAFVYVKPSTGGTTFRLDRTQVGDGFEHVAIRNVKKGTGYEVNCQLSNEAAVDEALRLAKMALEEVTRD